jgi:epsilon-lactone hydrolase
MRKVVGVLAGLAIIAGGALVALHLSARRLGISAASQFARAVLLPAYFPADKKGHDALDAQITEDRSRGPDAPPERMRKRFDVRAETVAGRSQWVVGPRAGDNGLRILYLHGGAYVSRLGGWQWSLVEGLVARTRGTVVAPDYPLAPEHTCLDGLAHARTVYEGLIKGAGARNVAVVGDSAGGGLALALMQELRDTGTALPVALVLLSPWLDVTCSDPTQPELEKVDRILSIAALRRAGSLWAGPLAPDDPRVSPLNGSLAGLPPIAVFAGTEDLLLPDARRLAEQGCPPGGRAEGADAGGAAVTLFEYPHQYHVWMAGMPAFVPEAGRALDQAAAFILVRAG